MLDIVEQSETSIDALEQQLIDDELTIGRLRARQAETLAALDRAQIARIDAARNLQDWVAARLDVAHTTAKALVEAAKQLPEHPASQHRLASGEVTFDRALATARLAVAGAPEQLVADSDGFDVAGVRRLAARQRRVTVAEERESFRERFLTIQPTLDDGSWRMWGRLPAADGALIAQALIERGDQLRSDSGRAVPSSRAQRHADALVALAQDSLDGKGGRNGHAGAGSAVVSIFVDAATAAATSGEAGGEVACGPRVGPAVLEEMLCSGSMQVIAIDRLTPLAASATSRAIPPAVRRAVLHRDGGCVIEGCSSRYRLQPHHEIPYALGGTHDPDNLVTLCWYHHHVAIHGCGYRLDPASPPQRRRLLPPIRGPD